MQDHEIPIAFYGTLMRGCGGFAFLNHKETDLTEHLGECRISGYLWHRPSTEAPWVVPCLTPGEGEVAGELHRLSAAAALAELDAWEGHYPDRPEESIYLRQRCRLIYPEQDAWVYIYQGDARLQSIPDGDWRAYRQLNSLAFPGNQHWMAD